MFLDSGANASYLYPSFRGVMTKDEIAKLVSKRDTSGGAGGTLTRKTVVAPTLQLEIAGTTVDLTAISLLLAQPNGDERYRKGILAMDALLGGFTLDFRSMRLELQ